MASDTSSISAYEEKLPPIQTEQADRVCQSPIELEESEDYRACDVPEGWLTCVHPQGWIYFCNSKLKATTDEDLRSPDTRNLIERNYALFPSSQLADHMEVHLSPTGAKFDLVINHKHCVASYNLQQVTNENVSLLNPNELNRKRRLYWNHLWNHPSHRPTPGRAMQDASDALTWFYTDNLLSGSKSVVPFSKSECEDLSRVIQNMTNTNQQGSPSQTVFLAWLLREVCSFRDAESYGLYTQKESLTLSRNRRKNSCPSSSVNQPSGSTLVFISMIINVFFFTIPWSYRDHIVRASNYEGRLVNVKHNWQTYTERLAREYSHFLLISTVLLSATVGFLAIPNIPQASIISSTVSAYAALGSIIVGVFSIWRHQSNSESKNVFTYMNNVRRNPLGFHGHAMLLSLPAVLLIYALIAFAVALCAYTIAGIQNSGALHDWSWWIVVGLLVVILCLVGLALYTFSIIWRFQKISPAAGLLSWFKFRQPNCACAAMV